MEILTPRLLLREYVSGDLDALLAYQAHPLMREHYGPEQVLPEDVARLLRTFIDWAREEPRRNWQLAVALREAPDRAIGSVGVRGAGVGGAATPEGHAELGLELAPEAWGRGYGAEAARAAIDLAFGELALASLRGETVSANRRVARLLERLGFRRVGSRAGPEWMSARGWAHETWELSRAEWASRRPDEPCATSSRGDIGGTSRGSP